MNRHHCLGWGTALVVFTLMGAACGETPALPSVPGATTRPEQSGPGGAPGATGATGIAGGSLYSVTVSITGSDSVSGTYNYTETTHGSCSDYARKGLPFADNKGLYLPPAAVAPTSPLAGKTITVSAQVAPADYHGPADYAAPPFALQGITVTDPGNPGASNIYTGGGSASMTTRDDGSGSITFSDMPGSSLSDPATRTLRIAGKFEWTCKDS